MFDNVIEGIFSAAFLFCHPARGRRPSCCHRWGALISEKAGVLNIGLEGMMLSSAFTGVVVSAYAQDWVRRGDGHGCRSLAGAGAGCIGIAAAVPSSWRSFTWISKATSSCPASPSTSLAHRRRWLSCLS